VKAVPFGLVVPHRRPVALLCAVFGLLAAFPLSAGVVLTVDNPAITGSPLDPFTLNGSLFATGVTVSLVPSSPPWTMSSPVLTVLGVLTPSGLWLPDGGSYVGPIALVQIDAGAPAGTYSSNPFSISFDDDNGRTLSTNSVNLTVDVKADVPEPSPLFLLPAGLLVLGIRRYFTSFQPGRETLVR
jgi:hypothetical protein